MIVVDNGDQFLKAAANHVLLHGMRASPRGKDVLECTSPVVIELTNVRQPLVLNTARRANYKFGMAEACWIASGADDVKSVAKYNRRMMSFSDDERTLWGAYGPRVVGQLPHVIASLKSDRESRQAVITTWRPQVPSVDGSSWEAMRAAGVVDWNSDTPSPAWDGASWKTKDTPCTVAWHFQLRYGMLQLTVFMRSNDLWLGLPYDVLSFTTVQRMVAAILGCDVGTYFHVVSNLHVYDEHLPGVYAALEEPVTRVQRLPDFVTTDTLEGFVSEFHTALHDPKLVCDPGVYVYGAVIHGLHNAMDVPVR